MSLPPSILLLDDGELGQVRAELSRLGMDVLQRSGDQIPGSVEKPRDLLITSGRRALLLPELEEPQDEPAEPVWICIHDGDFPRLRSRLRDLGVHYLVHSDTEPETPSLARAEWEHIHRVLADCGGNISEAARRLGIHRRSLQRKLQKRAPN